MDGVKSLGVLEQVEQRLYDVIDGVGPHLSDLVLHLLKAGGKRLRPRLVLSSAAAVGGDGRRGDRVIEAAVAVELMHLATLYHDDVIDSADTRRGQVSVNSLWGQQRAVLGGDVLLALSYQAAARLGTAPLDRLCTTMIRLCEGQTDEIASQFDAQRGVERYERAIRGKTASLFSASCYLGAVVGEGGPADVDALARFGLRLGVAFQIVDDVLDLFASAEAIGKPVGTDLREGIYTLPVLLALSRDPTLMDLLAEDMDDSGIDAVRDRVTALGAGEDAAAAARSHVDAAVAELRCSGIDRTRLVDLEAIASSVRDHLASALHAR